MPCPFARGQEEATTVKVSLLSHSLGFRGKRYPRSSTASRREDLQVEEPVACGDGASCHFHPTVARMLSAALGGHEVVQMGESSQKRLLTPVGMMEALHHEQLPLDGGMRLSEQGAGHRHLRVCEDRIPARLGG